MTKCEHDFTHIVETIDVMGTIFKKITIYCKKCGKIVKDQMV